uniref:Nicotinamide mononucleotide adenylyltransferase n=1 Tax=uncultured marine thaumarchaeote AD1000_70_G10 TaxID=1455934 RepID=A0A075FX11_9ARCH|nr:Nicotinamide mononucleotide adenylyltransferase [uncultured marine thaumarchaeote AD1000_70_G10]
MTRIRDMKVGILIGRFQPLHKGHVNAIEFARDNSERLFVIVGSAEKSNQERNPFSFEERKRMIGLALKGKNYKIIFLLCP